MVELTLEAGADINATDEVRNEKIYFSLKSQFRSHSL